MGQASLVGYWVGGAFASLAYFDEYWCILFVLDAARRLVAKEIAGAAGTSGTRLQAALAPVSQSQLGAAFRR
jgi:hypothetical protein